MNSVMDTNKNRQQNSQYGEGEYGINWGGGLLVLLITLGIAVVLIASMGG